METTYQIFRHGRFVNTEPETPHGQPGSPEEITQHLGRKHGISRAIQDGKVVLTSNCGRLCQRDETTPNWWAL